MIVAAAPNDAGMAKGLRGYLKNWDLSLTQKANTKRAWFLATVDSGWNKKQADIWFAQGQEQNILGGNIISRPGLHGWDKVDTGSALLARHLPSDLKGAVADFGCGWGYLSLQAAAVSKGLTHLTLVDIDSRAVDIARRNVQRQYPSLSVDTLWTDLTHPETKPGPCDAILLNPPFHDGTHALPALGQAIITTAAHSLKPGGRLYLVANRHLPYEKTLEALFGRVDVLGDEDGFKAFVCQRN